MQNVAGVSPFKPLSNPPHGNQRPFRRTGSYKCANDITSKSLMGANGRSDPFGNWAVLQQNESKSLMEGFAPNNGDHEIRGTDHV